MMEAQRSIDGYCANESWRDPPAAVVSRTEFVHLGLVCEELIADAKETVKINLTFDSKPDRTVEMSRVHRKVAWCLKPFESVEVDKKQNWLFHSDYCYDPTLSPDTLERLLNSCRSRIRKLFEKHYGLKT